ncbi:hypothetical protein [Paenibacillus xylanilyticus]|uniref:Uncharacterized protein n=1 Tax=Paenibacillus xylanilyticus TaxID=248903 RepID=A0A7Y6BTU6_9BACL|nr:hypothetical protein [Paenibacillus xylanilyticus]NUU74837.1 hypothetical protein [Paenibacillus xylanilyticus]
MVHSYNYAAMNEVKRIADVTAFSGAKVKQMTLDLEKCPVCGELILMKRGIAHD